MENTAVNGAPKIYSAISAIMADVGAVAKNSRNQQQGFMYRGIDAVMNALHPAMAEHHVFCTPEILEQTREDRQTNKGTNLIYSICRIRYTFYTDDGSNISVIVIGEGMDSGDKATNKAMAIAFKYACFQLFCIPTEEMVDPDAECHEVKGKGKTGGGKRSSGGSGKAEKGQAAAPPQENQRQQEQAASGAGEHASPAVLKTIRDGIEETGIEIEKILNAYEVKTLEEMTPTQAAKCIKRIEATRQRMAKDAGGAA